MVDNQDQDENIDVETSLHEAEGSLVRGWPAIVLTLIMIAAAVYAFSPRPHPPFPETQLKAGQMMTNGLAQQGSRFIAVGELGRIMIADAANGPWRVAEVEPQRGATLTQVQFIDDGVALAVGHSGWLLRSEDGGETWQELLFNENSADPLLGIAGPFAGDAAGKLFVFGAFGQYFISTDGGRSFGRETLNVVEEKSEDETADGGGDVMSDIFGEASTDPESEDYDPFASFEAGNVMTDYSTQHIYDIAQAGDGSLFLAGERGMILRSTDAGENWTAFEEVYSGSFYGLLPIGEQGMLVYGMRGNAFVTRDLGESWQQSEIPVQQGLYGAARDDGTIMLVGASNTVLVSRDAGASFKMVSHRGPHGLVSVLSLQGSTWLMAGEGGVGKKSRLKTNAGDSATGSKS